MAIDWSNEYVNINPPDANYPFGSAINATSPVAQDGTPQEELWMNDFYGVGSKLLNEAAITPSGVPDNINDSDYYDALLVMAVAAMGAKADANPLNHDKPSLGAWVPRSDAVEYQAPSDGFVVAYTNTDFTIVVMMDSTSPLIAPTDIVQTGRNNFGGQATIPVQKDYFWKVTGVDAVWFVPFV